MKQILPYFLLAVALVLLFFLFQANREVKKLRAEVNSHTQEVIEVKQAEILRSDSLVKAIQEKRAVARVKDSIEIRTLKGRVARLKGKAAEIPEIWTVPTTVTVMDSLGHVWHGSPEEFEQWALKSLLKDSIILAQDTLISTLELRHSATLVDLNAIISAQSDQIVAHVAIEDAKDQQLAASEKNLKRVKFRSTLKSVAIGVLTGAVVWISLRE